jgi:hypothetical protein
MVDISKFLESERKAKERDPEKYTRERAEDARRVDAYKDHERFENSKLMERFERMQKSKKTKGNPSATDDMLRQAFKAIDLEKDREGKKGLMTASEARERTDNARALNKSIQSSARSGGGGGGGGMNPIDLERVPGKRPLKMKKGGSVKSSASKRADGIAKKGKTRGKMV